MHHMIFIHCMHGTSTVHVYRMMMQLDANYYENDVISADFDLPCDLERQFDS